MCVFIVSGAHPRSDVGQTTFHKRSLHQELSSIHSYLHGKGCHLGQSAHSKGEVHAGTPLECGQWRVTTHPEDTTSLPAEGRGIALGSEEAQRLRDCGALGLASGERSSHLAGRCARRRHLSWTATSSGPPCLCAVHGEPPGHRAPAPRGPPAEWRGGCVFDAFRRADFCRDLRLVMGVFHTLEDRSPGEKEEGPVSP